MSTFQLSMSTPWSSGPTQAVKDSVRAAIAHGRLKHFDRKAVLAIAAAAATALLAGTIVERLRARTKKSKPPPPSPIVEGFHKLLVQRESMSSNRIAPSRPEGERLIAPSPKAVVQVVLTGGPVGGKASLAARFTRSLSALGWRVLVAPSVTTLLLNSNAVLPAENDPRSQLEFEIAVLEMQNTLERTFMRAAQITGEKCVIVYDRGILDVAAFLPRNQWEALAAAAPPNVQRNVDWYAAIVHLITAADGADAAFATEALARGLRGACASLPPLAPDARPQSKEAREHVRKAREHALQVDRAVHDVSCEHKNYVQIGNDGGFEAKMARAVDAVVQRVKAAEARGPGA